MKSIVAIRRVLNLDSTVREAVSAAGGMEDFVRADDRVLITPNLVVPVPHDTGTTTHPGIVAALIDMVLEAGGEPVVGECPPFGVDGDACLDVTGMRAVAEQRGVKALNLEHDEAVRVRVPRARALRYVYVARTAVECDAIISVPVLKNNMYTGITCGLKKMMGVTPGREKDHIHRVGLDMAIAELNRVVLPDLVVVDATVGMEGNAVDGTPVHMGLVLAGCDPVATDAVCARIIGLSEEETKHITYAAELGLGTRDLHNIKIDGPPLREVSRPFEKPWRKLSDLEALGAECGFKVDADVACSPCIGCVLMSITALKNRSQLDALKGIKTVAIGPNARVPLDSSGYLLVGNCLPGAEGAPNHLAGCPPNAHSFFEKLNEMGGGGIDFARLRPSKALDPGKS